MIKEKDGVFRISTENTSYWFRVTKHGHLETIHYGRRLSDDESIDALLIKRTVELGSSVLYESEDRTYCLDYMCLEWSGIGRGDFRMSPAEIKMPDGTFTSDFIYKSHKITKGFVKPETLPSAYGEKEDCETLEIVLEDESNKTQLTLYYTAYFKTDVITRRAVLRNGADAPLSIRRLMSMSIDIPNKAYRLVTFDGSWIREANCHDRALQYGIYVNSSTTGASSNRHNPGFLIAEERASETDGEVYGFNLVYSGNHFGAAELSIHDLVRVQLGINPYCFEWELQKGERFETPEAVMTFSEKGFGQMSRNFHGFINNHIVRGDWKGKERPVLINNWESSFFKFTRGKLMGLARRAKKLGVEMFVLDDGWFGKRDSDKAGLGDYSINKKKLPSGIIGFSKDIKRLGMKFGLWFEPEMVNEDSDLFRAHPEYAVTTDGKRPVLGRNQLVLDLCNKEVRDYIVENVTRVLDDADIDYVKWDMNRHMSDACSKTIKNQGEFFHRYIMGLYEILGRVFYARPHILFESCSSGGNRFDLGMLCFCQQVWTSDDTDAIERLKIQGGTSYLYPLSTMGAHVSCSPHQQTLRATPLSTRFNVAAFGCLGYEFDLKTLSRAEQRELKEQIEFYKKHRRTLQYGDFYRVEYPKNTKTVWQAVSPDKKDAVAGFFQTLTSASEGYDYLPLEGLDEKKKYTVKTKPQSLYIKRFGGLVEHLLPFKLNPEGFIIRTANKLYALTDGVEEYRCYGETAMKGVRLNNQFMGSGYDGKLRLLGDFGSALYTVEECGEVSKQP